MSESVYEATLGGKADVSLWEKQTMCHEKTKNV